MSSTICISYISACVRMFTDHALRQYVGSRAEKRINKSHSATSSPKALERFNCDCSEGMRTIAGSIEQLLRAVNGSDTMQGFINALIRPYQGLDEAL